MTKDKTLFIIDGYGFAFRAYHVQPPLSSPDGKPVGLVYGFTSMLLKVLNDFKPEHVVVVFDSGGQNFRHKIYDQYKANRPTPPIDLLEQLPLIRLAASNLNFPVIEKVGYEADDIIATLASKASALQEKSIIISSDKDLMQLLNGHTKMYDPIKTKYISEEDVIAKFGVTPDKIREVMALTGDKSDNIPGVPSIGPKTAAALIKQFGTVQAMLNSLEQITSPRQREVISASKELALISWQLVGLDYDVDVKLDLEALQWTPPDSVKISAFLTEYGFKSLNKRVENLFQLKLIHSSSPIPTLKALELQNVISKEEFDSLVAEIEKFGVVSIYLVNERQNPSIILSTEEKTYNIDINQSLINSISALLKDKSVKKITYNLKSLLKFFWHYDVQIHSTEDIELMQYLLTSGKPQDDPFKEAHNKGNEALALVVHSFLDKYQELLLLLKDNNLLGLYKDVDLPLCYVISKMEQIGIKINSGYLNQLSNEFGIEISELEQEIFKIAGTTFNIASPKQLGAILFDKMQLPFGKLSSKAQSYSTNSEVLEKLSDHGFSIADSLLKWRQLTKLKTTYTDSLPLQIDPADGRVHTTFLQTSTSTGRLSSKDPNLQNVPIRSLEGNKIRAAFIADNGKKLISADYSQIELRILSDIADMPSLKQAFLNGEDIHSNTACNIFHLEKKELTAEHRRKAKAINFGIIYGISAFGLAKQLHIKSSEAAEYIKQYFLKYPGMEQYMEHTKNYAKEHGYVLNLYGRKCFIPLIDDKKTSIKQFAERAAINAPIQGACADIIKKAMIEIDHELKVQNLEAKMVLQIHDELLFEAPEKEAEKVAQLIKTIMEKPSKLTVPLVVETKIGDNWQEIR